METGLWVILGIVFYIIGTIAAVYMAIKRDDGTSILEPIFISLIVTPVFAILIEALKPYQEVRVINVEPVKKKVEPKPVEKPDKSTKEYGHKIETVKDISDEDLQRYLDLKRGK